MSEVIKSTQNSIFKHISKLSDAKYRNKFGQFVLEGERLVFDAYDKNADIDFEIFSPRADMRVSKEMLNEMHQQMNDVKRQQAQTARELEEVTAKLDKFLYMLEEVQNLPD